MMMIVLEQKMKLISLYRILLMNVPFLMEFHIMKRNFRIVGGVLSENVRPPNPIPVLWNIPVRPRRIVLLVLKNLHLRKREVLVLRNLLRLRN
ncbi:hypothetical protein B7994_11870 [Fibrobacter sp. UWR2]|nr:hypothetical protein B7994_11870 [Fibrobacter sp. UWR2]